MAFYQVLYWQDIPSQVKAWDDFTEFKLEMPQRFVALIDQEAQARGLAQTDDYLAQWRWSEEEERQGTPQEVVMAVKLELELRFSK